MTPDTFPRDRYYCYLDDQPEFLVPRHLLDDLVPPYAGGLVVNPYAWFAWLGPLPAHLGQRAVSTENFYDTAEIVWVDDPVCRSVWPYWLGDTTLDVLGRLAPGQPVGDDLPQRVLVQLLAAQIVVPTDWVPRRRHAWLAVLEQHRSAFGGGYMAFSGLLPPFQIAALRRYYRYHTRVGTFRFGDEQTPGRYVAYDEGVTRYFQHQLEATVSDIVQRVVVPSYSYLSFYEGGATLEPHWDRDACEYTVSMTVDATPEPDGPVPWPLFLMSETGPVAAWQRIGDSLLFRGRVMSHWRDRLMDGYTSASVLWHFVDATGAE